MQQYKKLQQQEKEVKSKLDQATRTAQSLRKAVDGYTDELRKIYSEQIDRVNEHLNNKYPFL